MTTFSACATPPPSCEELRGATMEMVERLGAQLRERSLTLAMAESCTGGLIASTLTDVSGSSDWFIGGVVAYANDVKQGVLGVEGQVLERHGAVSEPVVRAMALGARKAIGADIAVAVSGIAGPTGGTPDKPVGTVWMAWDMDGERDAELHRFRGDRAQVKEATVQRAVEGLLERLARWPEHAA